MLHQRTTLRIDRQLGQHLDATLRITAHRMLNLDNIRAPIGKHGATGRHEGELRDLKDPHAFHHLCHWALRPRYGIISINPEYFIIISSPFFISFAQALAQLASRKKLSGVFSPDSFRCSR
jgi:hypothetical protein